MCMTAGAPASLEYFPPLPSTDGLSCRQGQRNVDEAGRQATLSSRPPLPVGVGSRLYQSPFLTGAFLSTTAPAWSAQTSDGRLQQQMPAKKMQQQPAATA